MPAPRVDTEPRPDSPTRHDAPDHEIVVIGAGFAGIGAAIKLARAGFDDFAILEAGDDVGGTWHWNTYPGIAVDIPSFCYQYSFEKRADWSRTYAPGNELKAYALHCVDKYGLAPRLRFNTTVTAAEFDADRNVWRLSTAAGGQLTARFVINACGILTQPVIPDIPGATEFGGVTMHTARWDHDQSLRGKRVGIIGTGASAVQVVPEIAADVEHLTVFQRTPIWCLPKPDVPLPRPAQWLLDRLPAAQWGSWLAAQLFVEFTFPIPAHYQRVIPRFLPISHALAKRYLRSQVRDPQVRDKLTPRYGLGCKRPSFHNSYLSTFNRPNVFLETTPISAINTAGVRVDDGTQHDLDVLIFATGFKVMDPDNMPTYALRGLDGVDLGAFWDEHRLQAYQGVSVPGYPNHFSVIGPYGYNGSSYFNLIEAQTDHILRCLRRARDGGNHYVEVSRQAHDRFFAEMMRRRSSQIFWQDTCAAANSYYFDKHGDVPLRPATSLEVAWRSRTFRLDDYVFRAG
ncbi:flavin-containing monooxygenase [Mycolicibacillus trivialis]|uniref:Monooxygenase n=1 Tax=Mycolicibacillus trivialis TaxID=1798 RepID=A0A1X2EGD4_9MYCO|nr:NAD(P)/FAD-dependent oxidoreductase [Mycolicibacillus trivialis]ORX01113.1 monooxygenase [Mycolicibacillus trivialis]